MTSFQNLSGHPRHATCYRHASSIRTHARPPTDLLQWYCPTSPHCSYDLASLLPNHNESPLKKVGNHFFVNTQFTERQQNGAKVRSPVPSYFTLLCMCIAEASLHVAVFCTPSLKPLVAVQEVETDRQTASSSWVAQDHVEIRFLILVMYVRRGPVSGS